MPEPGRYSTEPLRIATRGSALALAQARLVQALCQGGFPRLKTEIKIIKTTGDKLQSASLSNPGQELPKGLFTKEIEEALLANEADLAVHSLKDLPTELPPGLVLGAVPRRADPRDVLIYRDARAVEGRALEEWAPGQRGWRGFQKGLRVAGLPDGAVIGTGSVRREAQARILNPGLKFSAIRGNVGTRLRKLADEPGLDAVILAAAGLDRLAFVIFPDGRLKGEGVPEGLLASPIEPEEMAPCAGQGAIGIEIREQDEGAREICGRINHFPSFQTAAAERSFLRAMGGGCQSPVGAHGRLLGHQIHLSGVIVSEAGAGRAEGSDLAREAERLGRAVAAKLLGSE
jgi:hydroxymethylbilane synthase